MLIGPYKVNPAQVNHFPDYFSSPDKVERVMKNVSKKLKMGQNVIGRVTIFCIEYKYPQIT